MRSPWFWPLITFASLVILVLIGTIVALAVGS